jgi:putative ABC transport system permease protein
VLGVSSEYPELVNVSLQEGRFFDHHDEETHAAVCVIGDQVRRELFGFGVALGRPLKVNEEWLTVVGVLAASAGKREVQGVTLEGTANDVYLPVTTAERRFTRPPLKSALDELVVSVAEGSAVSESAAVVAAMLDRLHGGAADYTITVPEALLEQSRRTQRLFDVVMGAIAGISLLVGGIGIMNIMLATVLERTREIGIRRAVGARQKDVRNQFVMEAFAVTVTGGLLGVAMGLAIAKGVAFYAGWKTIVTAWSIVLSVGVSAGVGLVFGIYPALRAARLDPVEALHYE